ncbi:MULTISPECIES: hypothetical protein [unclassified Streptomyces]|uniref:hypothetical protein n=1 Tax=unclassified Streptomyces TaxID=2593676 RepID=UPI000CD4E937|nr:MULTISPECIES: hypothetical protein [unclassified Streptomyces]
MVPQPLIPQRGPSSPGRIPLAVVTVDGLGAVTSWGGGARRLFGLRREEALGRPAAALLPVSGVIDAVGDGDAAGAAYAAATVDLGPAPPTSGRFWGACDGLGADDVLWWSWPLTGPGLLRLLVLATDGARLHQASGGVQISAGFAPHHSLPDAAGRVGSLLEAMTGLDPAERDDIVAQLLELGYPMLESATGQRVPVLPRLPGVAFPQAGSRA